MSHVPIHLWAVDHWAVLFKVEVSAVRQSWSPDLREMRCDPTGHPGFFRPGMPSAIRGTILANGTIAVAASDANGLFDMPAHDDWDCLADLEAEGLLEWGGKVGKPKVALTDRGWEISAMLRRYTALVDKGLAGFRAHVCSACSRITYGALPGACCEPKEES